MGRKKKEGKKKAHTEQKNNVRWLSIFIFEFNVHVGEWIYVKPYMHYACTPMKCHSMCMGCIVVCVSACVLLFFFPIFFFPFFCPFPLDLSRGGDGDGNYCFFFCYSLYVLLLFFSSHFISITTFSVVFLHYGNTFDFYNM